MLQSRSVVEHIFGGVIGFGLLGMGRFVLTRAGLVDFGGAGRCGSLFPWMPHVLDRRPGGICTASEGAARLYRWIVRARTALFYLGRSA